MKSEKLNEFFSSFLNKNICLEIQINQVLILNKKNERKFLMIFTYQNARKHPLYMGVFNKFKTKIN